MLYTAVPVAHILQPDDAKRVIRRYRRESMIVTVEVIDDREGVVLSVLSTNPNDYLDHRLRPGRRISLSDLQD